MWGMTTVLVVDDEPIVREVVVRYLQHEGYRTLEAGDGEHARILLEAERPDLVVLDVMLPGIDGLELCRWIRAKSELPVILLTARGEEADRIIGLELGADDYLAKPFSVLELVARVKALLRRIDAFARSAKLESGTVELPGLRIDPIAREVEVKGKPTDLTPREFDLLHFFARNPGKVYSRMDLLNHVWGYTHDGYEHTVNTHINRLRMKVEADAADPKRILTVWGRGYKFALPEAPEGS
jgi:two-component system, OmpR family, response regulator